MYLCCCLKQGYSKPKCHKLQNVQLSFVSVQRTAQTSFKIFLQTKIIVAGAKFNNHDSAGCHMKNSHIFVIKLEVASMIKHAVTTLVYTSNGIKISTFLE